MLIHVTNITRDILGYENNKIVFFSTSALSLGTRTGAGGTATQA